MKAKTILIALAISTIFLLSSCGTGASHNMDDGTNMEGKTHEESTETNHEMDDGSKMEGETHEESENKESPKTSEVVDEESIVGDGKAEEANHEMDDGSKMEGETHME